MRELIDRFKAALLAVDRIEAKRVLMEAQGVWGSSFQLLEQIVAPTLEMIGTEWEEGPVSLSQVYMSGRICEELTETLLPNYGEQENNETKIAITTFIDQHALGKRIVLSFLRANGYKILDYGHGLEIDELVNLVVKDKIEILLISTLMLPSALQIKQVTQKLQHLDSKVKVIVGGAPFVMDEHLWEIVGANAMGKNAGEALQLIERMANKPC